jgi:hypothetical protein
MELLIVNLSPLLLACPVTGLYSKCNREISDGHSIPETRPA